MASFHKNVGNMMLGVGGAQLISLLAAPVIARLFVPEDFGVVALFMSIVAVAVIPTTLRLEHAIVLPKEEAESFRIISVAILSVLVFFSVGFLALTVAYFLDVSRIVESGLGRAVILLPFAVLLVGASNIATGYAARKKSFKTIGRSNLIQSIFVVSSRIIAGFVTGSNAMALVVTQLLGSLLGLGVLVRGIRHPLRSFFEVPQYRELKSVIREHRQFPLYSIPTGLLRAFNDNLPILVLATLFTPQVVGLYAMASRLIKAPVRVISEPIRLAYLQKTSELVQQNKSVIRSLTVLTLALFFLALLIILPLACFGRELFQLVLGQKWVDAGSYASIVSPWFASVFLQVPSSCVYIVYKKQKYLMLLQGAATIMMISSAVFVHALQLNVTAALTALSIVGTTLNLLLIANAFYIGYKWRELNTAISN